MKQSRQYILVGLVVGGGLALMVLAYGFLRGKLTLARTYSFPVTFRDARGVTPGIPVQMAGIEIGNVESVALTPENQARLRLRINDRYPVPDGARFTIVAGLLGGTPVVRVDPRTGQPGTRIDEGQAGIVGAESADVDAALAQSNEILASARKSAEALEKVVTSTRFQRNLAESLDNTRAISENARIASDSLPRLTQKVELQLSFLSAKTNSLLNNVQAATVSGQRIARNAEGLTSDLRGTLTENRAAIRSLVENADATASAVRGLTEQLAETVKDPNLRQNLTATTETLNRLATRVDTIAANFERLTGDPKLSSDLRETVSNLRETSASVRNLTARIETIRIPGERRRPAATPNDPATTAPPPPPPAAPATLSLLETGPVLDTVYDTKNERLRVDANFTLLRPQGQFYRAGIYDLTESNRLNLQAGRTLGATSALRYGIVAGKFGGGFDTRSGPFDLRFDLFDPNRLTLNLRAKTRIKEGVNATVGLDSAGSENRAVIGVQIQK